MRSSANRIPATAALPTFLEPSLKRHHQFTEHIAGTWPKRGITQSRNLGKSRSSWFLKLREHGRPGLDDRERCWSHDCDEVRFVGSFRHSRPNELLEPRINQSIDQPSSRKSYHIKRHEPSITKFQPFLLLHVLQLRSQF